MVKEGIDLEHISLTDFSVGDYSIFKKLHKVTVPPCFIRITRCE